jgi:predicted esterase
MDADCTTDLSVRHYYQVHVPESRGAGRRPLLVGLHGYAGDMGSMMRLAKGIAGEEMIVATMQGPNQFWVPSPDADHSRIAFGWGTSFHAEDSQTRHRAFIRRVLTETEQRYGADRSRVFLVGFSQACAHNYRFTFAHPEAVKGVVAICGGIPGDLEKPAYRQFGGGVLHIAATDDRVYPLEKAREFVPSLSRLAQDLTFREYVSPHAIPRRSIPFIRRWILERC